MPLQPQDQLGPYEIVAPLGAGGMGEVYRAIDPRLGREVAIKVLPPEFSNDEERQKRFEIEAQSTAALSHPNVLAVYDSGREGECVYLVTELLEGETLSARLMSERLSQSRALDIAHQIASGLSAAHERSITHRDLKPANVFLTIDGVVKVIDFGLAKDSSSLDNDPGSPEDTSAPTRLRTDPGTVLGTVGYMAPEQVQGIAVDHRADIFSFGAILFEMLSGKRAFDGPSAPETMTAILRSTPELSTIDPPLPPGLLRIVQRCLEKSPAERFQSTRDLVFSLETANIQSEPPSREHLTALGASGHRAASGRRPRTLAVAVLAALGLAALSFVAGRSLQPNTDGASGRSVRLQLRAPTGTALQPLTPPEISPDGRHVAFLARSSDDEPPGLWLQALDQPQIRRISDAPSRQIFLRLFWSKDSTKVGLFEQTTRTVVMQPIAGGPSSVWGVLPPSDRAALFRGADFLDNGDLVAAYQQDLVVLPSDGSEPRVIGLSDEGQVFGHPQVAIDGSTVLFTYRRPGSPPAIFAAQLADPSPRGKRVVENALLVGVMGERVLFLRDATAWVQSFDAQSFVAVGAPEPVIERVSAVSVSDSGDLAWSRAQETEQLAWVDSSGTTLELLGEPGPGAWFSFSHDGKKLAISRRENDSGITGLDVLELERGIPSRFSRRAIIATAPTWSPDDSLMAFMTEDPADPGPPDVAVQRLAERTERLIPETAPSAPDFPCGVSVDGHHVLVTDQKSSLFWVPTEGGEPTRAFEATGPIGVACSLSRDGRLAVITVLEGRQSEVHLVEFPRSTTAPSAARGPSVRISRNGGRAPSLSFDGQNAFFISEGGALMHVEVPGGDPKRATNARKLFALPAIRRYSPHPDGQRFLVSLELSSPEDLGFDVWLSPPALTD